MRPLVTADAQAGWLGVDWGAIALVVVVAFVVTVIVTASFALAVRLLAIGAPELQPATAGGAVDAPDAIESPRVEPRPVGATVGAWALLALGGAAALYGIYLVVPLFHG